MPLKLPRLKLPPFSPKRAFLGSQMESYPEAVVADLTDVVPVVGDILNVFRVKAAGESRDPTAQKLQIADTVAGTAFDVIPGGEVLSELGDVLSPTNQILYIKSHGVPRPPRVPAPPRLRVPRLRLPKIHVG